MKTILKSFCANFSSELDPFLAMLNPALVNLTQRLQDENLTRLNETVEKLQAVQSRAETLQEKIADQHAYLLIFGPLKSGKSTLMNAISGAYVSEVSCLPTYPALVYVKNGEEYSFQASTYEDKVLEYSDSVELKTAIQEEYSHLANALLEAERNGKEFDPKVDLPEAVRRVDVELPAENLAESGTILVDTPGLYSRMKFGYDQMTKDFRDTAACAIFVVKTDDLFFEKVFEEFEELLGYFSRIFLVSNIDSSKQDLQPDGSLNVSLEATDPGKVIEAFQSLSTSASLQKAIADGRLNIYSIDLLKAASRRLSEKSRGDAGAANLDLDLENTDPEETTSPVTNDGFDDFLEDLTSYLNSSDYLSDFMTDTVKMANELIQDEVQESARETIEELRESCDGLVAAIDEDNKRIALLSELEKTDWSACFTHLNKENEQLLNELEQKLEGRGGSLEAAIDTWLQSDECWNDLFAKHINPLLKQRMIESTAYLVEQLRVMLDNSTGGARFSFDQSDHLSRAGISLEKKVPQLLESFAQHVDVPAPHMEFPVGEVPLNLGLMDKLFMRSGAKVRQQLFGSNGEHPIAASKKNQRLAGDGINYLKEHASTYARETLPDLQKQYANKVVSQYIGQYSDVLKQEASMLKGKVGADIESRERKIGFHKDAIEGLDGIRLAAETFSDSLVKIKNEFQLEVDSDADFTEDDDVIAQTGNDEVEFEEPEFIENVDDAEVIDFDDTLEGKGVDYLASER